MSCRCQECKKKYKVDIMVPNYLWEQIKPRGKPKGAGLLCGECIMREIEDRGDYAAFKLVRLA